MLRPRCYGTETLRAGPAPVAMAPRRFALAPPPLPWHRDAPRRPRPRCHGTATLRPGRDGGRGAGAGPGRVPGVPVPLAGHGAAVAAAQEHRPRLQRRGAGGRGGEVLLPLPGGAAQLCAHQLHGAESRQLGPPQQESAEQAEPAAPRGDDPGAGAEPAGNGRAAPAAPAGQNPPEAEEQQGRGREAPSGAGSTGRGRVPGHRPAQCPERFGKWLHPGWRCQGGDSAGAARGWPWGHATAAGGARAGAGAGAGHDPDPAGQGGAAGAAPAPQESPHRRPEPAAAAAAGPPPLTGTATARGQRGDSAGTARGQPGDSAGTGRWLRARRGCGARD